MNIKLLEQIGLTGEQSKIYFCLLSIGTLKVRKIAIETKINRSLVYKVLKQLISLSLVVENVSKGSVSTFTPLHPSRLNEIVKNKENDLKSAELALHETIGKLGALFNINKDKPSIYFYEGIEGIKFLNKDILLTKMDIKLIRSPFDNNTEELDARAKRLLEERAYTGIKTKLIVPIKNTTSSITPEWDKKYHIERQRIDRKELFNSAQIIIYGNKVAFTSFGNSMITTIIEDQEISNTCSMLFDALWNKVTNY